MNKINKFSQAIDFDGMKLTGYILSDIDSDEPAIKLSADEIAETKLHNYADVLSNEGFNIDWITPDTFIARLRFDNTWHIVNSKNLGLKPRVFVTLMENCEALWEMILPSELKNYHNCSKFFDLPLFDEEPFDVYLNDLIETLINVPAIDFEIVIETYYFENKEI